MSAPIIFNGRRAKLLTVDGILNKDGSINDYNGLVNYVENGHAEVDVAGWVTYADAAGSIPVDGTGGSPTLTFTRTTSSPLRGTASFLITKTAENQGEGASYDFTIASADKAQMLEIRAELEVVSGTYDSGSSTANSDLICYIYDVTNSRLIEPAGMKLQVGMKFKATFQSSSDSTSYRLIFHQSLPGTSAYTLKLDNISVGPQVTASGYAGYDLKDAGTVASSWVSNATHTAKEGRRGDMGIFQFQTLVTGAPTSATYTLTLPNGRVMDTSKMIQTESGGGYLIPFDSVRILDAGNKYYTGKVSYASSTSVQVDVFGQTSTNIDIAGQVTQAVPMTFANGDRISVSVEVPIVGWSSNTVASSETDTRVVDADLVNSGTQAVTASTTNINFQTVVKDTHGAWTGSTYVVKVPGDYQLNTTTFLSSSTAAITVYVNGVARRTVMTASSTTQSGSTMLSSLNSGDIVSLRAEASVTIGSGCVLSLSRISGPAQITATEDMNCRVSGNPASASSGNPIIWPTVDWDTHGCYNATTGLYTTQISGKFKVSGFIQSSNSTVLLNTYVNASSDPVSSIAVTDTNGEVSFVGVVRALAGQTISLRPAGTLDVASGYVYIERIGNY